MPLSVQRTLFIASLVLSVSTWPKPPGDGRPGLRRNCRRWSHDARLPPERAEAAVLKLMVAGSAKQQIAAAIEINQHTVDYVIRRIYKRFPRFSGCSLVVDCVRVTARRTKDIMREMEVSCPVFVRRKQPQFPRADEARREPTPTDATHPRPPYSWRENRTGVGSDTRSGCP